MTVVIELVKHEVNGTVILLPFRIPWLERLSQTCPMFVGKDKSLTIEQDIAISSPRVCQAGKDRSLPLERSISSNRLSSVLTLKYMTATNALAYFVLPSVTKRKIYFVVDT